MPTAILVPPGRAMAAGSRLAVAFLAIGLAVPFVVASRLSPEPDGLATHQQLGLPPCTARVWFGIRCPACGMTTAWAHFVRGRWDRSLNCNTGGFLLACLASLSVAVFAVAAWVARWPSVHVQTSLAYGVIATGGVTLADWMVRLAWF
ncbi:MAG: DUF2752 domain-containing protein [Planctomycetota bacterium]